MSRCRHALGARAHYSPPDGREARAGDPSTRRPIRSPCVARSQWRDRHCRGRNRAQRGTTMPRLLIAMGIAMAALEAINAPMLGNFGVIAAVFAAIFAGLTWWFARRGTMLPAVLLGLLFLMELAFLPGLPARHPSPVDHAGRHGGVLRPGSHRGHRHGRAPGPGSSPPTPRHSVHLRHDPGSGPGLGDPVTRAASLSGPTGEDGRTPTAGWIDRGRPGIDEMYQPGDRGLCRP